MAPPMAGPPVERCAVRSGDPTVPGHQRFTVDDLRQVREVGNLEQDRGQADHRRDDKELPVGQDAQPPRDRHAGQRDRTNKVHADLDEPNFDAMHDHAGRQPQQQPSEVTGSGQQADLEGAGVQRLEGEEGKATSVTAVPKLLVAIEPQ